MEFIKIKQKLSDHVSNILKDIKFMHIVNVDKDEMWKNYLNSFPPGTNEILKERKEYDCSSCRHFIKSVGNVVTIKNGEITTIWDFDAKDKSWQIVVDSMSAFIKNKKVTDFFVTNDNAFGIDKNKELKDDKIKTWEHFYFKLPKNILRYKKDEIGSITGKLRDERNVFKRSLDEISENAILTILELISQQSLYRGEESESILRSFLKYHKEYHKLNDLLKELFCWEQSIIAGPAVNKMRNHPIGILLIDITTGADINDAVKKYEAMVAPANYKRPKAIFTQEMLNKAKEKVIELGFSDSLGRRFACLEDITIDNILFANKDSAKIITGDVFGEMSKGIAINHKSFDKVEEIGIDTFIKDVLPLTKNIDVLFENKHSENCVSLIAQKVKDSKTMFKWNNGFSWVYSGNIADSMKKRVKEAGGKVDGVLRFSIQWNSDNDNINDLDAHCIEPNGNEIWFRNKGMIHPSTGMLDVDIIHPASEPAIENITWGNQSKMQEGVYLFFVHNYNNRGGKNGFASEIEFNGNIYSFSYNKDMRQGEKVEVAKVTYNKKTGFKIIELLPSSTSTRKIWGIDTNQFHPVTVCMYSPNYWDDQNGIGNRHYFFMLNGCINPESPNGFFNEYLREELMEHKHVFEALGSKMRVDDTDNQLSGIGFSSTKRNSIVCKVTGSITRTLKINF
jgi:hypothetical protein